MMIHHVFLLKSKQKFNISVIYYSSIVLLEFLKLYTDMVSALVFLFMMKMAQAQKRAWTGLLTHAQMLHGFMAY